MPYRGRRRRRIAPGIVVVPRRLRERADLYLGDDAADRAGRLASPSAGSLRALPCTTRRIGEPADERSRACCTRATGANAPSAALRVGVGDSPPSAARPRRARTSDPTPHAADTRFLVERSLSGSVGAGGGAAGAQPASSALALRRVAPAAGCGRGIPRHALIPRAAVSPHLLIELGPPPGRRLRRACARGCGKGQHAAKSNNASSYFAPPFRLLPFQPSAFLPSTFPACLLLEARRFSVARSRVFADGSPIP